MATTPNGTVFTHHEIDVNGLAVRYSIADARVSANGIPAVLYAHGTNGDETQYSANPVLYHVIDQGGVVIQADTGNEWGGPAGIAGYRAAYEAVAALLNLGTLAIVGRSLGGVAAVGLYVNEPLISSRASGLVLLSGTADLTFRWDFGTTDDRAGLSAAYGTPVGDRAAFLAASALTDPMRIDIAKWAGKRVLHEVASGDTTVHPTRHGLALRRRIATGAPGKNIAYVVSGGDHNSSAGDAGAQQAAIDFLDDSLGLVMREVLAIKTSVAPI